MHVITTAGHIDHGKSALLQAITGQDPDRLAMEKARGLSVDLGFVWTTSPAGQVLAFVDVPGHHRFIPTMLAGAGQVPAVLFVVAADGGWEAQSSEHLELLDALGVRHGVIAVNRCDLADPRRCVEVGADAYRRCAATSLGRLPVVEVSSATGAGLSELMTALDRLATRLPGPDDDRTRIWIDRSFTVPGTGTVVTGTLVSGAIRVGDALQLTGSRGSREVDVRGLHSLGQAVDCARATARVAINLRAVSTEDVRRGDCLTDDLWCAADLVDLRVNHDDGCDAVAARSTLHAGSAAVQARVRVLDQRHLRARLSRPLTLSAGDRVVLRDPGSRRIAGATVLEISPPDLASRRGSARTRGHQLAETVDPRDGDSYLARVRATRAKALIRKGFRTPTGERVGDWWVAPGVRQEVATILGSLDGRPPERVRLPPTAVMSLGMLAELVGVPPEVAARLVPPGWRADSGSVIHDQVPDSVAEAVAAVAATVTGVVRCPDRQVLAGAGLGPAELASAQHAGLVRLLGRGIVVLEPLPGPVLEAMAAAGPITLAQARDLFGCSRRVALAVLEHLRGRHLVFQRSDATWQVIGRP